MSQMPKTLETVNITQAKNIEDLKRLLDKQIKIVEMIYRKIHNDVTKLRADVDAL